MASSVPPTSSSSSYPVFSPQGPPIFMVPYPPHFSLIPPGMTFTDEGLAVLSIALGFHLKVSFDEMVYHRNRFEMELCQRNLYNPFFPPVVAADSQSLPPQAYEHYPTLSGFEKALSEAELRYRCILEFRSLVMKALQLRHEAVDPGLVAFKTALEQKCSLLNSFEDFPDLKWSAIFKEFKLAAEMAEHIHRFRTGHRRELVKWIRDGRFQQWRQDAMLDARLVKWSACADVLMNAAMDDWESYATAVYPIVSTSVGGLQQELLFESADLSNKIRQIQEDLQFIEEFASQYRIV